MNGLYSGRAAVTASEYGVSWNRILDGGGVELGDEVKIDLAVEAVKQRTTEDGEPNSKGLRQNMRLYRRTPSPPGVRCQFSPNLGPIWVR